LDAGVNTLFTSFWYDHDIVPGQSIDGMPEPTIFYGPLCMNIDVVRDTMLYPPMEVGDRVILRNVGAYNVTQWMQFITYRPNVVLVGRDGKHGLIRAAEDLETIVERERMPAWLE
ncbi:MAG: diaminopimelate decarboxylase, partial [Myxococcota bacterium]